MNNSDFKDAFEAGVASRPTLHTLPDGRIVVIKPADMEVEAVPAGLPERQKGRYRFDDVASFTGYIKGWGGSDTMVFCDAKGNFRAVLNPGGAESPGWEDWVAEFTPRVSEEMAAWMGRDQKQMPQAEFAEFLEENADEVVEPDPATMIEIANTFQAHTKAEFRQGVRLANGQIQLRYEEEIQGKAGAGGDVAVPEVFWVEVPVFERSATAFRVMARLRYRLNSGSLTLGYKLHRPARAVEKAVEMLAAEVAESLGVEVYRTP